MFGYCKRRISFGVVQESGRKMKDHKATVYDWIRRVKYGHR